MKISSNPDLDLKVLIVDLSRRYGGSSSRVLSLLQHVKQNQIALAGLHNSPILKAAEHIGVTIYDLGSNKVDPRILFRLTRIIRQDGFHVVDTHNIQAKFWSSIATSITRVAFVSTLHSWYSQEHGRGSFRGWFYTSLELLTNRHLNGYITVSQNDREKLIQSGFPQSKIELIYNAVSIDPKSVTELSESELVQLNIPENAVICTAVGRLEPVKGYGILLKAIKGVLKNFPDVYCLIVGDGNLKKDLKKQIIDLKLQNRVHLLGYQNHNKVMSILRSSDIFVMPSLYEGTPISLLEAAALGKAIVASRVGGIPELINDGEQAILFSPGDHQALVEAITQFVSDKKKTREFGKQAQIRIRNRFRLDTMVQATKHAYNRAWKDFRKLRNKATMESPP
jgi:glycosyltransferase involved in cell wall biosynthesis